MVARVETESVDIQLGRILICLNEILVKEFIDKQIELIDLNEFMLLRNV